MSDIQIPSAVESERVVIGSIMIDGDAMRKVAHLITYKDFFNKGNALTFRAIEKLYREQQAIDVTSIYEELKLHGHIEDMGGMGVLVEMTNDVATTAHIVTHAKIVGQRSVLRNVIRAGADIVRMSQDEEDLDLLLQKAEERLKGVTRAAAYAEQRLALVDLEEWREIARNTEPAPGHVRNLSFGLRELDAMTEGLEKGEMMILTGHTKHGKSLLATNIAYNVAQAGKSVLFINTEMTKMQVARRFNKIAGDTPLKGRVILNDRGSMQYLDAIHLMERAKEKGCDLVIIDHLHFFSRSLDNEANQLSIISKQFKEAAVDLELPIIMLCHVSQSDTKKPPTLQSLKGSSSIAQDADIVITVWRDDRPNAPNSDEMRVLRLAHRSSNNSKRSITLFSDGMRLGETPFAKEQESFYDQNARMMGEKDDDLSDVVINEKGEGLADDPIDGKDLPW